MPLTITPIPAPGNFSNLTYDFIRRSEALYKRVYTDGLGVPTLGVGYALAVNSGTSSNPSYELRSTLDEDLVAIGIALTDADRRTLNSAVAELNVRNPAGAKALIPEARGSETDSTSAARNVFSFALISDANARTLFDVVIGSYVSRVRNRLGINPGSAFDTSIEMTALISLAYNGPALIGNKLVAAFRRGDRAGVWYEIRYGSNGGATDRGGLANRHYRESDLFGLYNNINNVAEEEAKNVLAVYTKNKTTILGYESQFAPTNSNATSLRIYDKLIFADRSLIAEFATPLGVAVEEAKGRVLVGTNAADTTTLTGSDQNDLIFGEGGNDRIIGGAGNDLLIGGAGDDILEGGKGNDYLEGGADNDTYIINAGDGTDTIEDKQGVNKVILNGKPISLLIKKADGSYASPEGAFTATISDTDLIVTDIATGTQAILNKDFQEGDFGIHFADAPTDSQTTLTINGDISPTDTNPNKGGIQAEGDAQGNPIGTAQPYEDILSGSAGNDHILSGALNDDIGSGAGNDWIEGGSGNDYIYGDTGNDLIEGGAGSDILLGGDDNDRLYGNVNVDTATAIASGNNDTGSGQKGDWLSGNAGADILIAGADNDVLAGGADSDLLIAGAGDDNILGDADYMVQLFRADTPSYSISSTDWYHSSTGTFDWTVTPEADTTVFAPVVGDSTPAGGGADTIYAGAGDDHVWAGEGDDTVFGEGGNDMLAGEAGNDILIGGADNDTLFGGADNDYLDGGDGNDTQWGGSGDDSLFGGSGDDKLYGEAGANYLDGEDGNDILNSGGPGSELFGGTGNDDISAAGGGNYLDGEDGKDTLTADGGNNTLFGGAGDDTLSAGGGNNYLDGEEGNNVLSAGGGDNSLFAGAGDDTLSAGGGNNYLDGGNGTNTLAADGGGNTLYGGTGNDTLSAAGGGNYLDGGEGTNLLIADGGSNTLLSGAGDDSLSSTGGNSTLNGGDGNDTLIATGGTNTLYGGAGNDTLSAAGGNSTLDGGDGNDVLIADTGGNTLYGGAGDDRLSAGLGGGNTLNGGVGNDTYAFDIGFGENHIVDADFGNAVRFNFSSVSSGIIVGLGSLKLSFANGDVLHIDGYDPNDPINTCSIGSFEFSDQTLSLQDVLDLGGTAVNFTLGPDITGTDNADVIIGTDKAEHIYALAGNDIIDAGARDDIIEGGDGNDTIDGGTGADVMKGGYGDDTYYVDNAGDRIIEEFGQTFTYQAPDPQGVLRTYSYAIQDYETVNASISYTLGANLENLNLTGTGDIDGTGNALDNYIVGNDGNNIVSGAAGDDSLDGGAGDDTLSGGTGNDVLNGGAGADSMAGGTGNDVYLVDDTGDVLTENLNEGTDTVQSTVTYTLGANVENLHLAGTDEINGTGNQLDNWISGNSTGNLLVSGAGNDTLNGGAGTDTMVGGSGDDIYDVDDAGDVIVENLNEGMDTVGSTVNYTLPDNVENLSLSGQGNIGAGNTQDNIIIGYNDNRNDNINYVLTGGAGNDTLTGNVGYDTLDGGSGVDVMDGGLGGDTYVVDNVGDQVIESLVGQTYTGSQWVDTVYGSQLQPYSYTVADIDTVNASLSYTLGNNLENLNLTGTDNIDGTGNALDNVINGNDGANTLLGGAGNDIINGGAGADVMDGSYGNDTFYVDNVGDQVIETVAGQTYTDWQWTWTMYGWQYQAYTFIQPDYEVVNSSVSFALGDNLEDLNLTGTDNIDGTGNELNNVINGNDGANTLVGNAGDDHLNGGGGNDTLYGGDDGDRLDGGAGADVMDGGTGNDTYYVDNAGDTAIEASPDGGWDTVWASVDFTLGANNERLQLTADAISGTGNELDNQIQGNDMDNTLSGLDGNDNLDGGAGNDTIAGSDGNDTIYGGSDSPAYINGHWQSLDNADTLDGGAGDDTIDGGSGDDLISGGTGDDHLYGGGQNNTESSYNYLTNDDTIIGGDGNDYIDGGSGADTLYGGAGDDVIYGGNSGNHGGIFDPVTRTYTFLSDADVIDGGDGDDTIDGQAGDDLLLGGAGDDAVYGGAGNDTLDGGSGLDALSGGQGDDVYIVDGSYVKMADVPTLSDCGDPVLTEQLVWTTDTVTEYGGGGYDVVYSSASYTLTDNVEELRLTFDPSMVAGDPQRYADLLAFGQNGFGNDLDNVIIGSELANRLEGGAGNDTLEGGAGNDTLVGDAGNDTLRGGAGDDRYVFRLGDGADTIVDNQGSDTLHIGSGLTLADIQVVYDNGNAVVSINGTSDSIVLRNWFSQLEGVSRIVLCDGTVVDRQGIASMASSPILIKSLSNQTTLEDNAYSFAIPADTFSYASEGKGDALSYSATMANGRPLPSWLTLDAATGVFSGTPSNWDVSALSLSVMAANASGHAVSSNFTLDVLNVNDTPTVVDSLPNQSITEEHAFSYTLPGRVTPDGFLNDATDTGTADQVWPNYSNYVGGGVGNDTYSFSRGDGNVYFSDWDTTTGNVDTIELADVSPSDVSISPDEWGSVIVSINGTSDSLTLSSWLYSDASKIEQLVFADGTVWCVNDIQSRLSTSSTTGNDYITGSDGNDTVKALTGDDGLFGVAGNDTLLGGAGNDLFDGGSGSDILVGGSGSDDVTGNGSYADTVNDLLDGGSGDDYLGASVSNDLLIGGQGNDNVSGFDGNNVILFNSGDGNDSIDPSSSGVGTQADTVSLGGGISIADLSFTRDGDNLILNTGNGESLTFDSWFGANWSDSSVQGNKVVNRLQIVAEATAGYDQDSTDPLMNKRIQQFDFVGLAGQFKAALAADPSITTWQLAPHLAGFSLGGSDTAAIGGDMAYLYGKNGNLDGLTEAEVRAQLNATTFGMENQTLIKATPMAGTGVFDDVDFIHGDTLTCSATLVDGSQLPAWLVFDAASGTFSGTPDHAAVGNLNVLVTATDTGGLSATTNLVLNVTGTELVNVAPTLDNPLPDQTTLEDNAFTFTIPADTFIDADLVHGDTLTYSATWADGNPLPEWLGFDATTGTFSGTPDNWDVGSLNVAVTAMDSGGLSASSEFILDVLNVNDAPIVADALSDLSAIEDQSFSFAIPAGSFNDDDFIHGDSLTYSATVADGGALPSWLSFDAGIGTFNGTPLNADVGGLNLAVTATDSGGLTASSRFSLSVANVNDSPTAADDVGVVQEDGGAVTLSAASLLSNDTDPDAGDTLNIVGVSEADSGATVSLVPSTSSGQGRDVQYDIGNLYQSLGARQTATDTFRYSIADADGATSTADVVMTITGVNDAPVTASDMATVQEDNVLTATGNVLSNDTDVDAGTVLAVADAGARQGNFGSLALAADGSYTYTLDNAAAAVQSLAEGQQATDTFAYAATDGIVNTPSTLTVAVTGANDAPVTTADKTSVQEDVTPVAAGNVLANDHDVDTGTVLSVTTPGTSTGTYGSLNLAADGSYTYNLANASGAVQSLAAGQSVTDAFAYAATDGIVSAASTLTVTVTGTNDAPVTTADTASAQEDLTLSATGNVLANDHDVDTGTVLSVAIPGTSTGTYGSLNLAADGSYTYTLANASGAVQALAAGQTVTDVFDFAATDGIAGTPSMLTVPIAGANDAPLAQKDTGAAREDGGPVSLSGVLLLANDIDVDAGDTRAITAVTNSASGALVNLVGGNVVYDIGTLFQTLKQGATTTDTFTYTMADDAGATSSATVTMTITGVNDAPVVANPIPDQSAAAGSAFNFSFAANSFTDIDAGDSLAYAATLADGAALPSWLSFNAASRTFTGTAPGGTGTGGGCGTRTGSSTASSLQLRVNATDTASASVFDVFALNISGGGGSSGGGQIITGTDHDDVLVGTPCNDIIDGLKGFDKMSGGKGDDVYYVDATCGRVDQVVENPNEGYDTVYSTADYTLTANVEELHLVGCGDLTGHGNTLNNVLAGNSANNTLDGGTGADTLIGGSGNDTYVVDNAGDVVTENAGEGTDAVNSSVTYTLSSNVENLTLTGSTAINGTGNALNNVLTGNSAANVLTGGAGNDTYVVGMRDSVVENANAGTDTVQSSITFTLGANVENLTLTGTTAINGTGNALDNVLTGNSAANVLSGGAGNDTYVVGTGDSVVENANAGTDTVQSSVTFTLCANVENLTLTGTTAISGTGNALDNVLTGNSAANTLTGGAGNDTYFVSSGDTVTEAASTGTDTVMSDITWTLGSNLENLFLTGTTAINGTGNTVANLLRGNSAKNTLTGAAGVDVLEGGAGNDTLSDSAGTDNGYYNGGAGTDALTGGSGREFFLGGTGNDTLTTGTGADIIAFNKGDGQDTVNASAGQDNVLSLGGNLNYRDLAFRAVGSDLVLDTGANENLTFKNWYTGTTNKSVLTLQVVAEAMAGFDSASGDPLLNKKVQTFNFAQLVNAFDAALVANPGLTSWALTNGLAQYHLSGSDTDALGGDLSYQYGENGTVAGIGFDRAQDVLTSAQFGTQAQTLRPLASLQDGLVRLG